MSSAVASDPDARLAARRASVPPIAYPPELPVSAARDEIRDAIRDHQIVVVAGETGSGKTTQLPKICLELGRGIDGLIGHTQPRRIAARAVADRVASELGVRVGEQVGSTIRFNDRTSEQTLVKVMTDGILLAEIQRDPELSRYDTIIIDEAHERSLNIDFLLGYLRQLLPRREDLKLIITSATIDLERFADHFDEAAIVEVSGRTYPVEVRYRPIDETSADDDQVEAICHAVDELVREGPGDILVFCSGEREIRDAADAVRAMGLRDTEVLPLYARLSSAEQNRVFSPHSGRRVVLATNVAETSLTVPGIRFVVDPGTARISRYSNRTKVQRLPIEKISQASANQRAGRCGRVADGICIRLYAEEDFGARPAFTDPEILRTNLASVVLQMTALGLGDVAAFGFIDPPDQRSVRSAVQLLGELGAVEGGTATAPERLTRIGRRLAALPVDPRLGRMLIAAEENGCLREVAIIVAGLSIQDPRERPAEKRHTADQLHARFADESSDFLGLLNLWTHVRSRQRALGSNAFRRECRAEFLHHLRIREWMDLVTQLRRSCKNLGMRINDSEPEPSAIHLSLLAGLLSHVGVKPADSRDYQGARGTRFRIWPGSALAPSAPPWVMAAELVETSRLWGRMVAGIEPEWVERLAPHLVMRTYSDPRWSAKRGSAVATERVTLYGLPLVAGRTVTYARIDPELSRELFIRHALVEREWRSQHSFLKENARLLTELSDLEHRARRRDIVVDDDALFAFYDARIPPSVVSGRHFDGWWKGARAEDPDLLTFSPEALIDQSAGGVGEGTHPSVWHHGAIDLPVTYRFAPGDPDDGVTVHIPLAVLNRVRPVGFDWQVPGLRAELVETLIRSLPKGLRRDLVPVPDVVAAVLARLRPTAEPLVDALARELQRERGVIVPRHAWAVDTIPDHLRITFRVVDGDRLVASGTDLVALQRDLSVQIRGAVARASGSAESQGQKSWTFGTLSRHVRGTSPEGHEVEGFPALVDEGTSVGVRLLLSKTAQERAMWQGTRRLLLLSIPPPIKAVHARLSNADKLALTRNPHGSVMALVEDCTSCAVESLMAVHGAPAWDAGAFAALRQAIQGDIVEVTQEITAEVVAVLAARHDAERQLAATVSPALGPVIDDARTHLDAIVGPGFVSATGRDRLKDLVRYVRAITQRVTRIDPARDAELREQVGQLRAEHAALVRRLGSRSAHAAVGEIPWMIEELCVSLFAQHLGTRGSVSTARIHRAMADAEVAARC